MRRMVEQASVPAAHHAAQSHTTPARRALALQCFALVLYICLSFLLRILSGWETFKGSVHRRLCRLLAIPPCRVYEPRESAIVIVGGDDDVGRHVALNFSELGCTVFSLCPEKQASLQDGAYHHASKVSSLIQEWHQRIKRSGRSPWGLVAPIVLDVSSETQRKQAFETVSAYCVTRNLHLVAVIVLPLSAYVAPKPLGGSLTDPPTWAESIFRSLVEPISVVQDYSDMLAAATGRVVLLIESGDPFRMHPTQLGSSESTAQFLRQRSGSLGIRVSTVWTGPFAPASKLSVHAGSDMIGTVVCPNEPEDYDSSLRGATRQVLQQFFVRNEDVWSAFYDIIRSRYPRERYCVGLHAAMHEALQAMPAALRIALS